MSIALISALTTKKVRHNVTFTGEITLHGRVLPVGSIKTKILAAHRAGVRTCLIPRGNRQDLQDLPKHVQRDIHFVEIASIEEALHHAIIDLK